MAPMAAAPAALASSGSVASPRSPSLDSPIVERPLTDAEVDLLRRGDKTGVIPLLRILGALTGIMPLSLIAAAAMGAPLVADTYVPLILLTGFLGVGFGSASMRRRSAIARAIARGTAREAYGIPEIQAAKATSVAVGLAGLSLQMKPPQANRLRADRMNKIVYVEGGTPGGPRAKAGWSVALALEWNGTPTQRLETFIVKTGAAGIAK